MDPNRITIHEVAREAGVSIATVSRFLNNPSSIKSDNRKRVDAAVKKLHYKPLVYARRLAGGKLGVYGLILPGYEGLFSSFYATEVIRGVGVSLEHANLDLHLHIFTGRDRFNTSLVDGVLFADVIGNEDQLKRLVNHNIPCLVINRKIEDIDVCYVAVDNFKGAYQAVELLISHGHKAIAHIAGDIKVQGAAERLAGYRSALTNHNLKINEQYIKYTNFSRQDARRSIEELSALSAPPTAIFVASDDMAVEVVHYVRTQGRRIPEDLSIVGFDDNPLCIDDHIALTTVRQPVYAMASQGVELLRSIVEKGEKPDPVILDPELVVRNTVTFV